MKPIKSILMLFVMLVLVAIQSFTIADDDPLQHYKEIWDAQRPKLNSGIIRYKQWTGGGDAKIREYDKVRSLFDDLSKDRKDYSAIIREFACKLSGVEVPPNPPEYPELVLYFKGKKVRYERAGTIEIFNGDLSIQARQVNAPAMQITIRDKGPVLSTIAGFSYFYHVPSVEMADNVFIAESQPDGDRLEIVPDKAGVKGFSMKVSQSGDVLEISSGTKNGQSSEDVCSGFREFGGVRVPQLIFKGSYNYGSLAYASIMTIVDATFTVQIDDNLFVQDAKAGDIIVDNRNGKRVVNRVANDTDDVIKYMQP